MSAWAIKQGLFDEANPLLIFAELVAQSERVAYALVVPRGAPSCFQSLEVDWAVDIPTNMVCGTTRFLTHIAVAESIQP